MSDIRKSCAVRWRVLAFLGLVAAFLPADASAHVKWFSEFSFADQPQGFAEVLTPTFWWLLALSIAVIALMLLGDDWISRISWINRFDNWLHSKSDNALNVMRIGVAANLLWAWQAGTLLAPDLASDSEWVMWLQFLVAALLVNRRSVPLSGVGLIVLYFLAVNQFGFFRMLDYLLFVGAGWFFIAKDSKKHSVEVTALPAIYATVGFCLIWLGVEKLIYPSWATFLLDQHPVLALGFDHDFFVMAAAFVEISLGFMIMTCLQERMLALFISLLFFLTTLVFGRAEVVGHTVIHAVLIVFLIAGSGGAIPPSHWIREMKLRIPATAIAFVVLLATFMVPYVFGSRLQFETAAVKNQKSDMAHNSLIEVSDRNNPPELSISINPDRMSGWNLELFVDNFRFAPGSASLDPKAGEGHAHLFIDGRKVARLYGEWYHIRKLPPGTHEVVVTLNGNNHATLAVDGKAVEAKTTIEVMEEADTVAADLP